MSLPLVTYKLTNTSANDSFQLNQNFTDLINSLTDGTKDLTVGSIIISGGIRINGLSASSLVATNASKNLTSTTSSLSPIFTGLNLIGLSVSQAVFTDGSKNLVSNPITGSGNVVMSASPTFTGTAIFSQLTFGVSNLTTYTEGTFTITGNGFSSNPTGSAFYIRTGNGVILLVPSLSGTSNATTFTLSGIPATIQPTRGQNIVIAEVKDAGLNYSGEITINTDGTAQPYIRTTINAGPSSTYTITGTKGVGGFTLSYLLT